MNLVVIQRLSLSDQFLAFFYQEELAAQIKTADFVLLALLLHLYLAQLYLSPEILVPLILNQFLMNSNSRERQIIQKKKDLIAAYQQKQQIYKRQIDTCKTQTERSQAGILKELESLSLTTDRLRQRAKEYMRQCVDSLEGDSQTRQIMDIKQLAAYLKLEKQLLKELTDDSADKKTTELDIHEILSRAKLESALKQIKKRQLQEQIKYLENNVISKGNLIYNAATAPLISNSDEKQLSEKLQQSVDELQRVISMGISCSQHQQEPQKLGILEAQSQRLKECEALLATQHEKLSKLIKYFESQPPLIAQKLPLPIYEPTNCHQLEPSEFGEQVAESELDQIIGFDLPANASIAKLCHRFEACQESIDAIRKKFKRIEKAL